MSKIKKKCFILLRKRHVRFQVNKKQYSCPSNNQSIQTSWLSELWPEQSILGRHPTVGICWPKGIRFKGLLLFQGKRQYRYIPISSNILGKRLFQVIRLSKSFVTLWQKELTTPWFWGWGWTPGRFPCQVYLQMSFSEVKIPLEQQAYAVSFCRILELNHSLRGLGGCQIWKPTQMSNVKCFGCLDYVMDHTTRLNREPEMA